MIYNSFASNFLVYPSPQTFHSQFPLELKHGTITLHPRAALDLLGRKTVNELANNIVEQTGPSSNISILLPLKQYANSHSTAQLKF